MPWKGAATVQSFCLTKAYDKVHRGTLWKILGRYGVPRRLVNLIDAMHTGARGKLKSEGMFSDTFELQRGLKQGSTFAPLLFNIFLGVIIKNARQKYAGVKGSGVQLEWDSEDEEDEVTECKITEILFADDCELLATDAGALQEMIKILDTECTVFGQQISVKKTKVLEIGDWSMVDHQYKLGDVLIEKVNSFKYLGAVQTELTDMDMEISIRIQRMQAAFWENKRNMFSNRRISLRCRLRAYEAYILNLGLFGCQAWNLTQVHIDKLESCHFVMLSSMCGYYRLHGQDEYAVSRDTVLRTCKRAKAEAKPIEFRIYARQMRFTGHVMRLPRDSKQQQAWKGRIVAQGNQKGRRGCPKRSHWDAIQSAAVRCGLSDGRNKSAWMAAAKERTEWAKTLKAMYVPFKQQWDFVRLTEKSRRHSKEPPHVQQRVAEWTRRKGPTLKSFRVQVNDKNSSDKEMEWSVTGEEKHRERHRVRASSTLAQTWLNGVSPPSNLQKMKQKNLVRGGEQRRTNIG